MNNICTLNAKSYKLRNQKTTKLYTEVIEDRLHITTGSSKNDLGEA